MLALAFPLFLISCLREDNVKDPVIKGVEFYRMDMTGKDSLVTEIFADSTKNVKIVVLTDADIVSVWPGAIRQVMKKRNSTVDSIDMFNHDVLVASDCYSDYGLVGSRGLATTLREDGWYVFYTYKKAGNYDMTIVATNHGYDSPDIHRTIYNAGTITIK